MVRELRIDVVCVGWRPIWPSGRGTTNWCGTTTPRVAVATAAAVA
jgi:hypothetical protein